MRYYVNFIQYNIDKDAENRTAPKAFNTLDEAKAEFYSQMGRDMKNETLGWSLGMVFNEDGGVYRSEKEKCAGAYKEPEIPEEVAPEVTE